MGKQKTEEITPLQQAAKDLETAENSFNELNTAMEEKLEEIREKYKDKITEASNNVKAYTNRLTRMLSNRKPLAVKQNVKPAHKPVTKKAQKEVQKSEDAEQPF